MSRSNLVQLLVVVLVAACSLTASAQTSTSRITGRVIDAKQASVPGATVTVTNEATGVSHTQTTTDAGLYAFEALPVGDYAVAVELTGFKKFLKTGNHLEVNTPLNLDVTLEVGQVSETVTVQGGAEQLQTTNATLGNVVEQKAIETLPLNGRNPLTLLLLEPGVVQRSFGGAGSGVHVNGSRDRAFNVTIDGIEANESSVPNPVSNLYRINPDNVQEFKVTTNNATAEEGRNSGASISIATRSGTSDFHGTVFGFYRNDALNANEWFANAQKTAKPVIRMGQYGFELGGPIKKNKTFFFGSWQYNRVDFTQPIDQTFGPPIVYTALARAGIFRYFVPDPNSELRIAGSSPILRNSPLLVDPNTGALRVPLCATPSSVGCVRTYDTRPGFGNNNNGGTPKPLDPAVANLLKLFPLPNNFSSGNIDGLNTATFLWNPPTAIRGPSINVRVDHNFNEKNSVFGRYLWSDYNTLKGDPLNGRPQVYPDNPALGEVFRRTSNLAIGWRRVISPRVVNELTAGYGRFGFLFTQGEANPLWPDVPPYDFTSLSEPWINTPRTARWVTTPQILDNLSVVHGAHVFRGGINFRFYRHVDQRGQPGGINVTPSVTFSQANRNPFTSDGFAAAANINASNDAGTLGNLINTLYGLPARISQTFISNLKDDAFLPFKTGDSVTLYAEKHNLDQYNLFFQDEWKVRPNLTLNYGARWEINPPANTSPNENVFVATSPIASSSAVTFAHAKHWYEGDFKWAIGPRFGLAYSPDFKSGFLKTLLGSNGTSVIRLGYGIAFDTISSFQVTAAAGRTPGLVQTCTTTFPFSTITPTGCVNASNVVGTTVAGGFPTLLPPPSAKPSQFFTLAPQPRGNAQPITVFAPQMQQPTVHEWNFGIQRELPGGFVMQASYIGRRGEHLFMAYDINQIKVEPILDSFLRLQANNRATNCLPSGATRDPAKAACVPVFTTAQIPLLAAGTGINVAFVNSTTTQGELNTNNIGGTARRIEDTTLFFKLRPNQQFGVITYLDNSGDSNYHAAQFTLRRRFSTGLGLSMAYTFGKSIDNQSVDPVGASSGGGLSTTNSRTPTDIRNFRFERARSDFDRTHAFTGATVWEVPLGRGKRFLGSSHGIVNQVIGGWTINSIFTVMSGEPFAVRSGSFTANGSHESRAGVQIPIKPQLQELPGQTFAGPVLFKPVTLTTCGVDLSQAFCLPAPGQEGAGRNIFTAPSYWNVDLGFIKTFAITERVNLQFRTEMFNAFNHANFDNPRDASVGSPSIQSGVFAQVCCAAVAPPSTQTIVQTGESARVIQFALKLQF
ncbi:MAG TPA: TonB-dependent receptor [Pyrinomonadaceae bacterium]|nr:TonB-dependent receptor [Pyrinomonadaceae bacterium]